MRRVWDWLVAIILLSIAVSIPLFIIAEITIVDVVISIVRWVNPPDPVEPTRYIYKVDPLTGQDIPECATEMDQGPCYWDADERKNGAGRSFTVDSAGDVHYWDEIGIPS